MVPISLHQKVNIGLHNPCSVVVRRQLVDTFQVDDHVGLVPAVADEMEIDELHIIVRNALARKGIECLVKERPNVLFSQH